jgi:methylmalonyl-CoA/ethylmalonyl-CoA epimerase
VIDHERVLQLNAIGQIAINVRDVPRAVAFYRDVLGMRHLFDAGPRMSFFDCGGVRLLLEANEGAEHVQPASILYYRVADLDGAHNHLVRHDVAILAAPALIAKLPDHELWMCFFKDTEGNTLALMQERR